MNPRTKTSTIAKVALAASVLLTASLAHAQTGGEYNLSWWTIDSGGGAISGGDYVLIGSVGQPDAGPVLAGGDYQLTGGFLPGKPEEPNTSVREWSLY